MGKIMENKEKIIKERVYLKPGKTNRQERINFVKFWANYVKTHSDEEWSEQQNIVVNSQIHWN